MSRASGNTKASRASRQRVREERDRWSSVVLADKDLTASAKNIASIIGQNLNVERADFYWGQGKIAESVGVTERTVREGLRALIKHGYLVELKRRGSHGTKRYGIAIKPEAGIQFRITGANPPKRKYFGKTAPDVDGIIARVASNANAQSRPADLRSSTGKSASLDRKPTSDKPIKNPINPIAYTREISDTRGQNTKFLSGSKEAFESVEVKDGDVPLIADLPMRNDKAERANAYLDELGFSKERRKEAAVARAKRHRG